MIWLGPWALLGLVGMAVPIIIHLLGRGRARVLRFPTLRFIDASRLLPTRRSRIEDWLLLAVRIAIVAIAAMALAQPLVLTTGRRHALDRGLARAIIVDTSASMRRSSRDSTRVLTTRLAAEARASVVVETNDPAAALRGAVAWVARQERRGEIAIVSDFQRGQIERADLAIVPTTVGVRLLEVASIAPDSLISRALVNGHVVEGHSTLANGTTNVEWKKIEASVPVAPVELFAAPNDASAIRALHVATATTAIALPIDTARQIAVIFSGSSLRDSILEAVRPARMEWALSLLADARREGLPISAAGEAIVAGRRRFAIVTDVAPASVDAARVVSAALRATSAAAAPHELDPAVISNEELRTWERQPVDNLASQHRPLTDDGPSDARWLWVIVLVLLACEWQLRRSTARAAIGREVEARAA